MAHWAAFLALIVQALIVQPHTDRASPWEHAISSGVARESQAHTEGLDEKHQACIVCQVAALGTATLVAPPQLLAAEAYSLPATTALPKVFAEAAPGHMWRSRAPPSSL